MNALAIDSNRPARAAACGMRLQGRMIARTALDARLEEAMFLLLASHFIGVDRRVFRADLDDKNAVILLEDDDGMLRGFSTLCIYQTTAPGRPVTIVYSGDTIVDRECWGSQALAKTWIHSVRGATRGAGEAYWLLLTSGYRTYRFLPVFFRAFHPRVDGATRPSDRALLHAVARERFGPHYDAEVGIVRFPHPQVLSGDLLAVPAGQASDAHVQFFLARNPGFVSGDELVCLARIHDDNLTPAGRRVAGIRQS